MTEMLQQQATPKRQGIWRKFFLLLKQAQIPWLLIFLSVVTNLVSTKVGTLFPDYQQKLTSGDLSQQTITTAILILVGSALLIMLSTYVNGYTTALTNRNVLNTVWAKVLRLPIAIYQRINPRELISRTVTDTAALGDTFVNVLINLLSGTYGLYLSFGYIMSYHPTLLYIQLALIPVSILIKYVQGSVSFNYSYYQQARLSNLTEYLSQVLINIPLVKVFLKEQHEKARGERVIKDYNRSRFKLSAVDTIFATLDELLGVINTLLAVLFGTMLIKDGQITVATWISYYLYTETISANLGLITSVWPMLKAAQGSIERVLDFMEEDSEVYEGLPLGEQVQDIVFSQVSFAYGTHPILKEVNLTIPKQKFTAIVGSSGAGKTTILGLIERFFQVDSGTITYGGQDIQTYQLDEWRSKIAYVTQEINLLSGTIRENLTYGIQRQVSDEELMLAAQQANIHDHIMSLKDGYQTLLSENGGGLSGGERQRLTLARLFLKQPDILLLDEATSNLDADSEHLIMSSLSLLAEGRTVITVAHRMRTVEHADQIIVVDKGRIVGCGTHQTLSATCDLYRRLLAADFKD